MKNWCNEKRDLPVFWLFEKSASVLEQAKQSYGSLKLVIFATKWGPFCLVQQTPFGKSSQYIWTHTNIHTCTHTYDHTYKHTCMCLPVHGFSPARPVHQVSFVGRAEWVSVVNYLLRERSAAQRVLKAPNHDVLPSARGKRKPFFFWHCTKIQKFYFFCNYWTDLLNRSDFIVLTATHNRGGGGGGGLSPQAKWFPLKI